jgi:hypothetical protein
MPLLFEGKSEEHKSNMLRWLQVRDYVNKHFGKRPDLNAILFLIGINELGKIQEVWSKEEKQDLMHVAICTLFMSDGYFVFMGRDEQGWPHFETTEKLPKGKLREQEELLKSKIIDYFAEKGLIPNN